MNVFDWMLVSDVPSRWGAWSNLAVPIVYMWCGIISSTFPLILHVTYRWYYVENHVILLKKVEEWVLHKFLPPHVHPLKSCAVVALTVLFELLGVLGSVTPSNHKNQFVRFEPVCAIQSPFRYWMLTKFKLYCASVINSARMLQLSVIVECGATQLSWPGPRRDEFL